MKRIIKLTAVGALLVATLLPFTGAKAIDDIIRVTVTYYHTTVELNGTFKNNETGETLNHNTSVPEQDGNYTDESLVSAINDSKGEFTDWANSNNADAINFDEGIDSYYYDAHDEITEVTTENYETICADVEGCEIGKVVIKTVLDKHQVYLINASSSYGEAQDDPEEEETTSATTSIKSPDTGSFTASSSATSAVSLGTFLVLLIGLAYIARKRKL